MSYFHSLSSSSPPVKTARSAFAALSLMLLAQTVSASHAQATEAAPQVGNLAITAAPHPYNDPAEAPQAVKEAFEEAHKTNRLVMLIFGANWCPDCRVLEGTLENPAVAPWVKKNFVVASVNVDHFQYNKDIASKFGITVKAIPVSLIITPDGKVLNPDTTLELGNARTMSAQAIVDKLNEWKNRQ